ncbi:hypothetical protein FB565_006202 [Actinoplanes lutulentus]|uniref:Uncharacterized protein n=1 Tax=Actinoplanes lutulentus TaxID=1287878 RepID=A0A327YWD6_9ACTN|nr:hypothetical protein [Actinoplanes lutulentus]MBB2946434.1 hypothetical protein [Actinoplanes lutulentus]RAK25410.1 hypothetical protein B0I29_13420 [Actinoplanes lutulentus]
MFEGIRNHRFLRRITDSWFWEDVRDFLWSRSMVVFLGNAGTLIIAVVAVVHFWSRPYSFAGYLVVQLACLLCQAIAFIPVVWPGPGSSYAEVHQSVALLVVCGTWIFAVPPALILFAVFDVDSSSPPWAAMFVAGVALTLACAASLMASVPFEMKARDLRRRMAGPPEETDGADFAESESEGADSGGSDGD